MGMEPAWSRCSLPPTHSFSDVDMMEALRPSIEEAQPVQSQELALDYIGAVAPLVMQPLALVGASVTTSF
jgi:hypothetical protein